MIFSDIFAGSKLVSVESEESSTEKITNDNSLTDSDLTDILKLDGNGSGDGSGKNELKLIKSSVKFDSSIKNHSKFKTWCIIPLPNWTCMKMAKFDHLVSFFQQDYFV